MILEETLIQHVHVTCNKTFPMNLVAMAVSAGGLPCVFDIGGCFICGVISVPRLIFLRYLHLITEITFKNINLSLYGSKK